MAPVKRRVGRPRASRRRLARPPQEEILFVAARLFASKGFGSTTTREIAHAAGLRQPSLFHYFASKEAILAELLRRSLAPSIAFAAEQRAAGGSPSVRLYRLIRFDVAHLCSFPFDMGAILAPEARHPRFRKFWSEREQFIGEMQALVGAGVEAGELVTDDLPLATRAIFGMGEWTLSWSRAGGTWTAEAVADGVATLALRGLLRDPQQIDAIRRAASAPVT
jgi:TetR/AcrR family transcriptional regulator